MSNNNPPPAAKPAAMSSQMQAVMRVMTGQGERTIAEKLADSNRPTWEQYKKDNQDKLNIEGIDHKKMEEYRKQLDRDREPQGRAKQQEAQKQQQRRQQKGLEEKEQKAQKILPAPQAEQAGLLFLVVLFGRRGFVFVAFRLRQRGRWWKRQERQRQERQRQRLAPP
eukprot:jgi/Psemu1/284494/fgenesh1_pg.56_\